MAEREDSKPTPAQPDKVDLLSKTKTTTTGTATATNPEAAADKARETLTPPNPNQGVNANDRPSVATNTADMKAAQIEADKNPQANRQPVGGAVTAPVPAPQQTTTGNINATDLTRPNTTIPQGADDVRSQMVSDAAAESSTLTANASMDPNAGTHQIPGDALTPEDIELAEVILAQRFGGTRENVYKELQRRKMERQIAQDARRGEITGEGPKVYFRSSIPAFAFRPGRGVRLQFENHFFATDNPAVIYYIRTQLMNVRNSPVVITESSESDMQKERTIVQQPVIEPLPGSEGLDNIRLQRAALFTKAPRTDANPDPIIPETGNGPRDQLSSVQVVSTPAEVRAAVSAHQEDVVQQRRNAAEFAAAQGDGVAADALANAGTRGGATAGATTTTTPAATRGGFTTGMQGSTGPSSAPRRPQ